MQARETLECYKKILIDGSSGNPERMRTVKAGLKVSVGNEDSIGN
jgi:hypothetical protein